MSDDVEMLTVEDALVSIKRHLTESGGVIARIESGEGIDQSQVQSIRVAFQSLQVIWKEQVLVPKHAVYLLREIHDTVISRLDTCMRLYPQQEKEIRHFMTDINVWMNATFSTMSEEAAIAIVCQQLLGMPSFVSELRSNAVIDEEAV